MNGHGSRPARGGRYRTEGLALSAWLICTLVGGLLIDLDSGRSVVSLTMGHGVSLIDAAGAALLLAGWSMAVIVARRSAVPLLLRPRPLPTAAALFASCAGLLIAALLVPDFSGRKFVVAGFILLVEGAAAASVLTKSE
jgi:hypothetical protein